MLKRRLNVLLFFVTASAVVNIGKAIECYHCRNCSDAEKLEESDIKSCDKATFNDDMAKLGIPTNNEADGAAKTCYKMALEAQGRAIVIRGCFVSDSNECHTKSSDSGAVTLCVCGYEKCNSAPESIVPYSATVGVLVIISWLLQL